MNSALAHISSSYNLNSYFGARHLSLSSFLTSKSDRQMSRLTNRLWQMSLRCFSFDWFLVYFFLVRTLATDVGTDFKEVAKRRNQPFNSLYFSASTSVIVVFLLSTISKRHFKQVFNCVFNCLFPIIFSINFHALVSFFSSFPPELAI